MAIPQQTGQQLHAAYTQLAAYRRGELTPQMQAKLDALFERTAMATQELGARDLPAEKFIDVVSAYSRDSRFFHALGHLFEMTEQDTLEYRKLGDAFHNKLTPRELLRLQQINHLAGFYHDMEYVTVDGSMHISNQDLLATCVTEKDGVYTINSNVPPVARLVNAVFGFKEGDALNPFGGANEYLSALAAALNLQQIGVLDRDILGVVASIEATVPFRGENRMNELRARMLEAAADAGITGGWRDREIDMLVANAVLLANRDISSLLGGLTQAGEPVTAWHLQNMSISNENMQLEEVPALRVDKPGAYPPIELMKGILKRACLFSSMLAPDGTVYKCFHGVELPSQESEYPPEDEVKLKNTLVAKTASASGIMYKARLAAAALVTALAKEKGVDEKSMAQLLHARDTHQETLLAPSIEARSDSERIVYEVLGHNRDVAQNDTPKSYIAAYLLAKLGEKGIDAMLGVVLSNSCVS